MKDIIITIPRERLATKAVKSANGDFTLTGIKLGDKFIRLSVPSGYELPKDDTDIIGNLYARSYETPKGKFYELAIWVKNATAVVSENLPLE